MTGTMTLGVLVLVGALLVVLGVAVRRDNRAAVVNTVVVLGTIAGPSIAEYLVESGSGRPVDLPPELTLWIAVAGFLHALGMLGLYESSWWWDHLTHTVSAALAAALIYAGFLVLSPATGGNMEFVAGGATVAVVLSLGIAWEALELVAREIGERFDIEPVLIHYGWRDTGFDLVFDVVGALGVVMLDVRLFVPVVEAFLQAL